MHRATPVGSSFRAYAAGGAGSVVDSVVDGTLMQEMKGNFMKGESRSKVEAPQNYGFSSVTADADKPEAKEGGSGQGAGSGEGPGGGMGAEAFISFAGGNRSFATALCIDDRRHRLKGLEKGDVAMFGQRDWGSQFHMNKKGTWITANDVPEQQGGGGAATRAGGGGGGGEQQEEKRIRMQLVANEQESDREQQGSGSGGGGGGGGASATALAGSGEGSGGSSGGQQQGKKQAKGQKQLYDKESTKYFDLDRKRAFTKHGDGHAHVEDKKIMHYYKDENISTKVTDNHVHIKHTGKTIWVDESGCWSSVPIQIRADPETTGTFRMGEPIGTMAAFGTPPLSINRDGYISMAIASPLFVDASGRLAIDLAEVHAEIAALREEVTELRAAVADLRASGL